MDGQGDVTESHVQWIHERNGPSTPSPLLVDGQLLFVSDNGVLSALNEVTGQLDWRLRIGGNFCASPLAAGGFVYLFDRDGKATVIRPGEGDEPEIVAKNKLDQGLMASPVVGGRQPVPEDATIPVCH